MARNFGITSEKTTTIRLMSTTTPSAMIHHIDALSLTAMMMPPMAMIGAKKTMRIIMITSICTWVMSLVVRVMSEAVEKRSNSAPEKRCTFSKTNLRRSRARPAPVRADSRPTATTQAAPIRDTTNMRPPVTRISADCAAGAAPVMTPTWMPLTMSARRLGSARSHSACTKSRTTDPSSSSR